MTSDLPARGDSAGLPLIGPSLAHPLQGRVRSPPGPDALPGSVDPRPARVALSLHVAEELVASASVTPADLAALRRTARTLLRSRGWTVVIGQGAPVQARISIRAMPSSAPGGDAVPSGLLVGLQAIVVPPGEMVACLRQLRDYTIARLEVDCTDRPAMTAACERIGERVRDWLLRVF